jgi:hypothetical protein
MNSVLKFGLAKNQMPIQHQYGDPSPYCRTWEGLCHHPKRFFTFTPCDLWILGVVYTMDHEVVLSPINFGIGCWTRLGITSTYTKENMSKWPWSSRSPKRYNLRPIHWHRPTGFVVGEAKEVLNFDRENLEMTTYFVLFCFPPWFVIANGMRQFRHLI